MHHSLQRLALMSLFTACGGKTVDSSYAAYGSDGDVACGGSVEVLSPGARVDCASGSCTLEVQSTDPAPPDRGDNLWVLRLLDSSGAPLPLRALVGAPFMPAHNHGTSPAEFVGMSSDQIHWSVGPFDLFMPGFWELRVAIEVEELDDVAREVVVPFCVEG